MGPFVWPTATVALLLLAGCTDPGSGSGDGEPSFEDAMAASGEVYEGTDPDVRLKMLEPASSDVSTGPLPVRFVLYDAQAETPITDATFPGDLGDCTSTTPFCAEHLGHGHGTSPEKKPRHQGDGIYEGSTTMSMEGSWRLNINPQLGDGRAVEFDVPLDVTD